MGIELINLEAAAGWIREGRRIACAQLIEVEGSAPLPAGASMFIDADGRVEGSITGGCVEAALVDEAMTVLQGAAPRIVTYGIADELAGSVGLSCGGTVHVFVQELAGAGADVQRTAFEAASDGRPVALATLLDSERAGAKLALVDGEPLGSLGGPGHLDEAVARDAAGLLDRGLTAIRGYGADGAAMGAELRVHVRSFAMPAKLIVVGAVDFSAAVADIGSRLGYLPTICDPRAPFANSARFRRVAEVVVDWPDRYLDGRELGERDCVLVFTHDPKLDVPALTAALASGAGYIGALGSRRTTADRNHRLLEAGVDAEAVGQIHAPCGLDIGSSTADEVAISVLAEIVACRSGRSGLPLRKSTEPIHPRVTA
ncbi:MAG: XdhC family protein [Solirubrobacterales bacterium]